MFGVNLKRICWKLWSEQHRQDNWSQPLSDHKCYQWVIKMVKGQVHGPINVWRIFGKHPLGIEHLQEKQTWPPRGQKWKYRVLTIDWHLYILYRWKFMGSVRPNMKKVSFQLHAYNLDAIEVKFVAFFKHFFLCMYLLSFIKLQQTGSDDMYLQQ